MPDQSPTKQFDLTTLRLQITKMSDRILMRLHDRAGFPLNRAVYTPGGIPIPERPGVSLLEFALEGLEAYHASLGRYEYPGQFPLVSDRLPSAAAERTVNLPSAPPAPIVFREQLVSYYVESVLPKLCAEAEDPSTYGETAYVDADLLELLNERINVGRYVALAKLESEPELRQLVSDADALKERLRDTRREESVLAEVAERARRYEVDPALAQTIFRWVIEQVLQVEVVYLQRLTER